MSILRRKTLIIGLLAVLSLTMFVNAAFALSTSVSGNILSGAQYDLWALDLIEGESVTATLVCDFDGVSRPLDPVLSVFFPGSDSSDTINADVYNDDGFGSDDDPNGIDCDAFDSSRVFFSAPVTGTYTFRAEGFGSSTGPYTLTILTGGGNPLAADGRINPQADAPIIAYCNGSMTDFYSVTGQYQGSVAAGDSATFGAAVVSPTDDGRMQVSAGLPDGKTYLLIWEGCPSGNYQAFNINNGVPSLYDSGSYR